MSKTKKLLLTMLILLTFTKGSYADECNFVWAKKAGGTGDDNGRCIAVDGSGNQYITGSFSGTATFGSTTLTSSGDKDIFIAKLNSNGDFFWVKKAGGTSWDEGSSIAVDVNGNLYVTGFFKSTATFGGSTLSSTGDGDIFITKLNASGDFLWAKKAGGTNFELGSSIVVDASGNQLVTGYFYGTANFNNIALTSAGESDIFIAKLNTNGDFLWAKKIGGIDIDQGTSIAVDGNGNHFVTGCFSGTVNFGSTTLTSAGDCNVFIAKLGATGNFIWAKKGSGAGNLYSNSIVVDVNGNTFITGSFQDTATFGNITLTSTSSGNSNFFIAKLDATGNFIWAKKAVGEWGATGNSIAVDGNGNQFVTGYFYNWVTFGSTTLITTGPTGCSNTFIAKLDASGNFIWAKGTGGASDGYGNCITVDTRGNQFVTGSFSGIITFGNTTSLTATGSSDIFIAKCSAPPLPVMFKSVKFYDNVTPNSTNQLNIIQSGKKIRLKIQLTSNYSQNLLTVKGQLVSESPYATVTDDMGNYNNILQGQSAWSTDEFEIQLAGNTPENAIIPLKVIVTDEIATDDPWISEFSLVANLFKVQTILIDDDNNPDSHGNDNDIAEPSEVIEIIPIIQKMGSYNTSTIAGTLLSGQSITSVWNNHAGASGTVLNTYNYQNGGSGGNSYTPEQDFVFDYLGSSINKLDFTLLVATNIQYDAMGATAVPLKFGVPFSINNGYPAGINEELTPTVLTLENSYPNPFNNTTSIKFALPKDEFATLLVYNLKGEEVAQLAKGQFTAGYHTVDFNATNLTSGVYIYTLQTASKTMVNKMLMVK